MRINLLLLLALLGGCAGDGPPAPAAPPPIANEQRRALGRFGMFDWSMRYQPELLTVEAMCAEAGPYEDVRVRTLFKDAAGKELIGGESVTGGQCLRDTTASIQEQQAIWPEGGTLDITVTLQTPAGSQHVHWGYLRRGDLIEPQP